jgi:hypothetical protein
VKVSTKPLLLSRKDKFHQECKWKKRCVPKIKWAFEMRKGVKT